MDKPPASDADPREELTAISGRLLGYARRAGGEAQYALIPEEDPRTRPTRMEYGRREALFIHVRRMEYVLKCFILWLAARLIDRAQADKVFADQLLSDTSRKPLAPAENAHTRPQNRDNDIPPDFENIVVRQQLKEFDALRSDRVTLPAFCVATPQIMAPIRRRSVRRKPAYQRDSLMPVDARHLLARFSRLSGILKRADAMAERLAARTLRQKPALTGPLTPYKSLWFKPLQTWLPPEDIWRSAEDEDERSDLSSLHYRARQALSQLGVFPENKTEGLPGFARFRPPDPPQIRSV